MCVLRVSGKRFDATGFAARTALPVSKVYLRGEPMIIRGRKYTMSGVTIRVSSADWDDLPKQMRDAERFLKKHSTSLSRLARRSDIDVCILDFPIDLRIGTGRGGKRIVVQSDSFPPSLVRSAARFGLGLELTIYG